jgi:hypothetical protein
MHHSLRLLLVSAAALAAFQTAAAQPTVLRNDDLSSGSNWLKYSGSGVTLANNALSVTAGSHAITYFTDSGSFQSLGVNHTLEVTFDLKFTTVVGGGGSFRVGLFDSNTSGVISRPAGTQPNADPHKGYGPSNGFNGFDGYAFTWNPDPGVDTSNKTKSNVLRLNRRTTGSNSADGLLNSTADGAYISDGLLSNSGGPAQAFQTDVWYRVTYTISRGAQKDPSLSFSFSIAPKIDPSTPFSFFKSSVLDPDPSTRQFDTFGIYSTRNTSNIILDEFRVSYINDSISQTNVPEPSTYAACAGAAVLGLAFWRRRRAAAKALAA